VFAGALLAAFLGFAALTAAAVLSGATLFFGEVVALGTFAAGLGIFFVFGVVFAAFLGIFLVVLLGVAFDFFDAAAVRFAFFALLVFFFVRVAISGFLWLSRTTASRRQRRRSKFDQSRGRR